ncbi:MAG: metallopeptidase family protein [Nitrospiraceae bacterium]
MVRRRGALAMTEEEFVVLVEKAIEGLPARYAELLENVAVVVEDEPSPEVIEDMELESGDDLLGLYTGVAVTKDSFFQSGGQLPARIEIYRVPILKLCRSKREVIQEVRDTVVHEIGHHFGLDDDEMPY